MVVARVAEVDCGIPVADSGILVVEDTAVLEADSTLAELDHPGSIVAAARADSNWAVVIVLAVPDSSLAGAVGLSARSHLPHARHAPYGRCGCDAKDRARREQR